jgi:hypothetical protein
VPSAKNPTPNTGSPNNRPRPLASSKIATLITLPIFGGRHSESACYSGVTSCRPAAVCRWKCGKTWRDVLVRWRVWAKVAGTLRVPSAEDWKRDQGGDL